MRSGATRRQARSRREGWASSDSEDADAPPALGALGSPLAWGRGRAGAGQAAGGLLGSGVPGDWLVGRAAPDAARRRLAGVEM